jgi:fused signal recognition particle receptor
MFSFFKKKPKDSPDVVAAPTLPADIQISESERSPAPPAVTPPLVKSPTSNSLLDTAAPATLPDAPAAASTNSLMSFFKMGKAPATVAVTNSEETSDAEPEIIAAVVTAEKRSGWLTRLKSGLAKTSSNLTTLFIGAKIGDELYEELESALLMSDAGVNATQFLLDSLRKKVKDEKLIDAMQVKAALKSIFVDLLAPLQKPLVLERYQPLVMMVTGVNGAGKTTTIGKLAKHLQAHRQSVLLAAGDTFRAAAREQLTIWGERNNVAVISQESGDPAAVAFDAVHSAQAKGVNVVMIDTAGRLPTQLHLMEELKKIKRVIAKGMATAPHEILLVIDGNTGQNALAQVRAFDDALGLTGLVVTKLDGTAKGGVLAAIAKTRPIPVYFIGVGEQIDDLQPFNAEEFVDALLG